MSLSFSIPLGLNQTVVIPAFMPPFYIRTQAVSDYDRLAERKIGYFRKTDIKELLVRLLAPRI